MHRVLVTTKIRRNHEEVFLALCQRRVGPTAIEIGFVLLLISMVVIVSSEAIGNWLNPTIDNIANDLPS